MAITKAMTYRWERCQFVPDPEGDWVRIEWTVPAGTAITPPGIDGQTIIVWTLIDRGKLR